MRILVALAGLLVAALIAEAVLDSATAAWVAFGAIFVIAVGYLLATAFPFGGGA